MKKITTMMMLIGLLISCDNSAIDSELSTMDMGNEVSPRVIQTGKVYYNNKEYYIDGPYIASKTATHPLLTSPTYPGNCTLICEVTYHYYKIFEGASAIGPCTYAGGEIQNIKTIFTNNSNVPNDRFYLLWQDVNTRAFYTSSSIDPIVHPQSRIYVVFEGQIVGETEFFGISGNYPKPINSSSVLYIEPF